MRGMATGLLLIGACTLAQAHVTLKEKTAPVGGSYHAVLQVSHGCGKSDTTRVRVRIPDGVIEVQPQSKAGWTITTREEAYAEPQALDGAVFDRGVREIDWSGNLPHTQHGTFAFTARLAPTLKPGQTLYFPVVQECKHGVVRWIDTSGDAASANPAPRITLTDAPRG